MTEPRRYMQEQFKYQAAEREDLHRLIDDILDAKARVKVSLDFSGDGLTADWGLSGKPSETSKLYGVLVA